MVVGDREGKKGGGNAKENASLRKTPCTSNPRCLSTRTVVRWKQLVFQEVTANEWIFKLTVSNDVFLGDMLVLDDLILWAGFILTCIHHWRNDRIFIVPTTTSKDHQNVCWNRYRCITTWSASIRAQESLQLWNCSYFLDWVWSHRPSAVAETVSGQWFDFCIFLPCWLYNIFSKTNKYSAHPTQDEMRRLEAKFKGTEECQALGGRSCICEHRLATLKYDFFYTLYFFHSLCVVYTYVILPSNWPQRFIVHQMNRSRRTREH